VQSGFLRATVPADDPDDPTGGGATGDNTQDDTMSDVGGDATGAFAGGLDLADTGHLSLGLHLAAGADLHIDTDALDLGE
jgi:hypothetical protein